MGDAAAADIETRLRVPVGKGRATDPDWTELSLVSLAPRTLKRPEAIAKDVRGRSGVSAEPMQLAALLLEKTTEQLNDVRRMQRLRRLVDANPPITHSDGRGRMGSSREEAAPWLARDGADCRLTGRDVRSARPSAGDHQARPGVASGRLNNDLGHLPSRVVTKHDRGWKGEPSYLLLATDTAGWAHQR